jgi:hypothetical protein
MVTKKQLTNRQINSKLCYPKQLIYVAKGTLVYVNELKVNCMEKQFNYVARNNLSILQKKNFIPHKINT